MSYDIHMLRTVLGIISIVAIRVGEAPFSSLMEEPSLHP